MSIERVNKAGLRLVEESAFSAFVVIKQQDDGLFNKLVELFTFFDGKVFELFQELRVQPSREGLPLSSVFFTGHSDRIAESQFYKQEKCLTGKK